MNLGWTLKCYNGYGLELMFWLISNSLSFFSRIRIKIHYPLYWPFRDFWKSWFKLTMWWDHVQLKIKKCYLEKVLVKTVKLFGKSFLYIKNKNGLKLLVTCLQSSLSTMRTDHLKTTLGNFSESSLKDSSLPLMFFCFIFYWSPLCHLLKSFWCVQKYFFYF